MGIYFPLEKNYHHFRPDTNYTLSGMANERKLPLFPDPTGWIV